MSSWVMSSWECRCALPLVDGLCLLCDAFEEVGGLLGGLGGGVGDEDVALFVAVFFEDRFGLLHERSLRCVGGEGLLLAVEDGTDVECDGPRRREWSVAIGEEVAGGDVVETLRLEEWAEFGVALGGAGPVEGRGGSGGNYGVVGVGVECAVAAEGDDDVGADGADAFD